MVDLIPKRLHEADEVNENEIEHYLVLNDSGFLRLVQRTSIRASYTVTYGNGLIQGPDDLSEDLQLAIDFATNEEAINGISDTKVMNPKTTRYAVGNSMILSIYSTFTG